MQKFEIESIEGVGYIVFEQNNNHRTRRIGDVFQNIQQARQFLGLKQGDNLKLVYHNAYEEMINGEEEHLDLITPAN